MNPTAKLASVRRIQTWVTFWLSINDLTAEQGDLDGPESRRAHELIKTIERAVRARANACPERREGPDVPEGLTDFEGWAVCEPGEYSRVEDGKVQFEMSFILHASLHPRHVDAMRQVVVQAMAESLQTGENAAIAACETHHELNAQCTFEYSPASAGLSDVQRLALVLETVNSGRA